MAATDTETCTGTATETATPTASTGATPASRSDIKTQVESFVKFLAAGVGLAYGTGYLVVLTFLNEYGIRETAGELFKLRYIYVGGLCLACPTVMLCLLLGLLSGRHDTPVHLPALSLRQFGERLFARAENMPWALTVLITCLMVVFFCIIAFAHPGLFAAKQPLINLLYGPLFATVLLRLIFGEERLWSRNLNRIRWVLVLASIIISVLILKDIDFASMISERAYNYLILQILFFFFLYRFLKWPLLGSDEKERAARRVIRIMILSSLFLLGVFSFAHTIFNHIPAEKGGGDFSRTTDSRVCFSEANRTSIPLDLLEDVNKQPSCSVPVKIVEETGAEIYVARSSDRGTRSETEAPNAAALWRSGAYYPVVFDLSRSAISSIAILNGGSVRASAPVLTLSPPSATGTGSQPPTGTGSVRSPKKERRHTHP